MYHYAGNNPVKYVDPDGREDDFCLCNNDFDFSTAMNVVGTGLTVLGLFLDFGAPLIAAALAGATGGTGAVAAPLVIAGCQAAGEALALAGATVLASNSALSYASNVHLSSNVKNQSKTSGKGSNVPVPETTNASNGLKYRSNPKHTPGQTGNRANAGIEPKNSLDLFEQFVEVEGNKARWTYDKTSKTLHRFFNSNDGTYHWSGSTNQGINSLKSSEIPPDVRKVFNLKMKGNL